MLTWYKPTDHPQDSEDALWMAHGFGGRYAIQADGAGFILWLADDEFSFKPYASVALAQAGAEEHFAEALARIGLVRDETGNPASEASTARAQTIRDIIALCERSPTATAAQIAATLANFLPPAQEEPHHG